jgi:hypothetical protein
MIVIMWIWRVVSLFFFLIGCYFSIFSVFLFDAPGSESNPTILSIFYIIISIPLVSLAGIITGMYQFPLLVCIEIVSIIILLRVLSTRTMILDRMNKIKKRNGLKMYSRLYSYVSNWS